MMQCQPFECVLRLREGAIQRLAEMPRIIPQGCVCPQCVQCTFYHLSETAPITFCEWQSRGAAKDVCHGTVSCVHLQKCSFSGCLWSSGCGQRMMPHPKRGGQCPLLALGFAPATCLSCSDSRLYEWLSVKMSCGFVELLAQQIHKTTNRSNGVF